VGGTTHPLVANVTKKLGSRRGAQRKYYATSNIMGRVGLSSDYYYY